MSDDSPHLSEPLDNALQEPFYENNLIYTSISLLNSDYVTPTTPPPPLVINTHNVAESLLSLTTRPPPSTRLPRSLKIVSWNCCGVNSKSHQILDVFDSSQADILILVETFRQHGTPWPVLLPPLLAEATSSGDSRTRQPAGVAVLVNPLALRRNGNVRSFEILSVDNLKGTKVVIKVNNLIIMAVYAPVSQGCELLASHLQEASALAANGSSVLICGDFNAPHEYNGHDGSLRARHRTLVSNLGPDFFRADTGPIPTRPSNRSDSLKLFGSHFWSKRQYIGELLLVGICSYE